jgi:hypothetical protein
LKEKFENKKLNTSDSKHNIPTYMLAADIPIQTDRQTDRQAGRQTDRQTEKE